MKKCSPTDKKIDPAAMCHQRGARRFSGFEGPRTPMVGPRSHFHGIPEGISDPPHHDLAKHTSRG
ncbi:MAG: hypothetical protein VX404_07340 [Planctomycetota bacterium]|nr:hypothetical protein [Planctomycetota bacterium]